MFTQGESFWHTHNSFFLRIILYDIDRPGFFRCQFFRVVRQAFRGVRPPVQQNVFNQLQPVLGKDVYKRQGTGPGAASALP